MLTCSLASCGAEVVGTVVVIGGEVGDFEFGEEVSEVYHGHRAQDNVATEYLVLHPTHFMDVFQKLCEQESYVGLTFIYGPVGEVKEALGMRPDE